MSRTIKSFVKRGGRLSNRQKIGLEEYLDTYRLPIQSTPWHFSDIFGKEAPVFIEIGFGMGDALIEMASAQPGSHFIGMDVHEPGIGHLAASLHEAELANVRIVTSDAVEMIKSHVPEASIDGFFIFFPDPWHKKKHHKRRLITPAFVTLLVHCLKPGGFVHCATDWESYALQMEEVLSGIPLLQNSQKAGGFLPGMKNRPLTKFEQRGLRLGHSVWDLKFVKRA